MITIMVKCHNRRDVITLINSLVNGLIYLKIPSEQIEHTEDSVTTPHFRIEYFTGFMHPNRFMGHRPAIAIGFDDEVAAGIVQPKIKELPDMFVLADYIWYCESMFEILDSLNEATNGRTNK